MGKQQAAFARQVSSVHTIHPILGTSLCDWIVGVTGYNPAAMSIPKVTGLHEEGDDVRMTYLVHGDDVMRTVRIPAANLREVRYGKEDQE